MNLESGEVRMADKYVKYSLTRNNNVTDMDSNIAVLVYYNNVAAGVPDRSSQFYYNSDYNNYSVLGPQNAVLELPTTSQWKNVKLTNSIRNIEDDTGTVRIPNFSYGGYAARLLTIQEVSKACGISLDPNSSRDNRSLANCNYFVENTTYAHSNNATYGYWLESLTSSQSTMDSWVVYNYAFTGESNNYYNKMITGIRPVIEVPKSDILY